MNLKAKRTVFYVILAIVAGLIWTITQQRPAQQSATYSRFLEQVQSGEVTSATVVAGHTGANRVRYQLKNGGEAQTVVPADYRNLLEILQQKMVNIEIRDASSEWLRIFANMSPFLLLLGVWIILMNRLRGHNAG